MKHILWTLLMIAGTGFSQCSELFFSEYIEGSSSNKAFEIYNPTDTDINLEDYVVYRNNNGSTSPSDSLFPQGTLAAGDVFVVCNPSADLDVLPAEADTFHTMTFYNGDDALWLKKTGSGDTLDIIGKIGVDPGTGWAVGSGATNNYTLIRQISVRLGQTDWALGATEWDVFPLNMDDSLGTHAMLPCFCSTTLEDTACTAYLSPDGAEEWTTSGIYMDTIPNALGCDTIYTIHLEILSASFAEIDTITCDSLISPSGHYTWTESGTYMDTIPNAMGCDSILTLNLTVHNSNGSLTSETACDSFTSPGGEIWTSSGIYLDTLSNIYGCDSIISVNLTVNYSSSATFDIGACKHYTSPSGKLWDSPGTYPDTIPNVSGCDSLLTINLTIFHVDVTVTQTGIELTANNPGGVYQWLDCDNDYEEIDGETLQNFTAAENGNYAVRIFQDGCVDTSHCFAVTTIGVLENDFGHSLLVYPNPTYGKLIIDLGAVYKEITAGIYTISGEHLTSSVYTETGQLKIDLNQPAGIYFIILQTAENKRARIRIQKE